MATLHVEVSPEHDTELPLFTDAVAGQVKVLHVAGGGGAGVVVTCGVSV